MDELSFKVGQILGVIVLYDLNFKDSITVQSLNASLKTVSTMMDVVIYNNSKKCDIEDGTVFNYDHLRIHYFHNPFNPGVSKAYNFSVDYGIEKLNKEWILLLDQDTFFPLDTITEYINNMHAYSNQVLFVPLLSTNNGIYSPSKYYFKKGFIWKNIETGLCLIENRSILNSGLLIKIDAYLKGGGYNEKIKLYFSDFNFIDRYRKHYKSFVILDLICLHELSDLTFNDSKTLITRFNQYCKDSYNSAESTLDIIFLFLTVLLRSFKLALRYKSLTFLKVFLKTYLKKMINFY